MSQFGRIYRMEWDTADVVRSLQSINVASKDIRVNIYDTDVIIDDDQDPEIFTLRKAFPPLTISSIDNDEDKFRPVRAKQAIIRFLSDSSAGLDFNTFADAADNRFKVEILADGEPLFDGFLMLADIGQSFLPDPQTVELTASDCLGILKDIPWTTDDGDVPAGKYRIAEIIALCLKKTGLTLDINVVNNVKHGGGVKSIVAGFSSATQSIIVGSGDAKYFYPGQEIVISGTVSNNGTRHVAGVTLVFIVIALIAFITLVEPVTDEDAVLATFTDNSSGHIYDKIYLDAQTFESNIGETEDCRTVLEKILGEDCYLSQYKGAWWIMRVNEITDAVMYPARFDPDGVFDDYLDPITPSRSIGDPDTICHEGANTSLRADRRHKYIRETYRYISPREIFCNIDFSRGDVIDPPDLSAVDSTGTYQAECWTLRRLAGGITSTAHIARRFEYGYQKDKYLVITPAATTGTPWDFMESSPIEVRAKDKASISIEWRYETNFGGGGGTYFPLRIYLKGDDGNWYYWWHPSTFDKSQFYWTVSATEAERLIPDQFDAGATDETNWRNISIDLAPIPVDGKLYIGLNQGHQGNESGDNQNINYQGISFDYRPFINGSYETYTGQYNQITRSGGGAGFNARRENEVYISDSPRKNFKGAMFFLSNGTYFLTAVFFEAQLYAMGPVTDLPYNTFGYIQAFAVWNQYKNANRIFPSQLYGLLAGTSPEDWPDLMKKYLLTDTDPNTNNRFFMLISFSQNWKECKWNGVLIECFNTETGHTLDDDHDFRYLTE